MKNNICEILFCGIIGYTLIRMVKQYRNKKIETEIVKPIEEKKEKKIEITPDNYIRIQTKEELLDLVNNRIYVDRLLFEGSLYCDKNDYDDLQLEYLTDLTALKFGDYNRHHVDFSKLTNLVHLDIEKYMYRKKGEQYYQTDFNISELSNLTYLRLGNHCNMNMIFEYEKLTNLKYLVTDGFYEKMDLSKLTNLEGHLNVRAMTLNLSNISKLTELSILTCSNIDFSTLTNLKNIHLRCGYEHPIDISMLTNLTRLQFDIKYEGDIKTNLLRVSDTLFVQQ